MVTSTQVNTSTVRWPILKMKFPSAESTTRPSVEATFGPSTLHLLLGGAHPSPRSACRRVNPPPHENDGIHVQLGSLMIQQRWGPPRWPLTSRYVGTQSAHACKGAKSVAIAILDPTRNVHLQPASASRGYKYHLHNCTGQIGLHACRRYPISFRHGSNRRRSEALLLEATIKNYILPDCRRTGSHPEGEDGERWGEGSAKSQRTYFLDDNSRGIRSGRQRHDKERKGMQQVKDNRDLKMTGG
ncbi:hypothetical protein BHE74_00004879 [Ensete ventricosum]|nr:hypothetical protein BHE74_00004879 [Ensete ventricosum]